MHDLILAESIAEKNEKSDDFLLEYFQCRQTQTVKSSIESALKAIGLFDQFEAQRKS